MHKYRYETQQLFYPVQSHWHRGAILNRHCHTIGQSWSLFSCADTTCQLLLFLLLLFWPLGVNTVDLAVLHCSLADDLSCVWPYGLQALSECKSQCLPFFLGFRCQHTFCSTFNFHFVPRRQLSAFSQSTAMKSAPSFPSTTSSFKNMRKHVRVSSLTLSYNTCTNGSSVWNSFRNRDLRIGNFRSNRTSNRIGGYDLNLNQISNRIGG